MKKIILILSVLLMASSVAFAQEKRLPYELRKGAATCDTVYTLPDEKAGFPGGTSAMYNFFKQNLQHSEELTNINFTRRLALKLLIDNKGKVLESEVRAPLSPEYDKDALNVVSMFPDLVPAKVKDRNVCSSLIIPLFYK